MKKPTVYYGYVYRRDNQYIEADFSTLDWKPNSALWEFGFVPAYKVIVRLKDRN